jgi:hypothetical protein
MLDKEHWLEVGAMEIDLDDGYDIIQISAIDVDQLLPEAMERIKEKAMLDEKYKELCKQVTKEWNIDKNFSITNDFLCWKCRIYMPEGIRQRIIQSQHDSTLAGHFGRERTLMLISRHFYWVNMERNIGKYCS